MTPIGRARELARRLGVRTGAQTLKGVLRAIKSAPKATPPAARPARIYPAKRVGISWVLNTVTQSPRDRVRTLPPHAVLRAVVEAAVLPSQRCDYRVGAVPNRYKGAAMESFACAVRQGRAIRFSGGRTEMPHTTGGTGGHTMTADRAAHFILAADLWAAFPPMPRGWRFSHDGLGLRLLAETGADYHPSGEELAEVITTRSWSDLLARMAAADERRRLFQRTDRVRRRIDLIRKLAPSLEIKLTDSIAVGNCEAGTRSWALQNGLTGEATTFDKVGHLASNDRRVALTIIAAFRRARLERRAARA